jgi:hypothetical protein
MEKLAFDLMALVQQAIDFRAGVSILGLILPSFVWRPCRTLFQTAFAFGPRFRKTSNIRHLQLSNACLGIVMETRSAKQSFFAPCLPDADTRCFVKSEPVAMPPPNKRHL